MRIIVLMFMSLLIGGCATNVIYSLEVPSAENLKLSTRLETDSVIYVGFGADEQNNSTVDESVIAAVGDTLKSSLRRHVGIDNVLLAQKSTNIDQSLLDARQQGARYILYSQVIQWSIDSLPTKGVMRSFRVRVIVIDTRDHKTIDNVILKGNAEFPYSLPFDSILILNDPIDNYVSSLF